MKATPHSITLRVKLRHWVTKVMQSICCAGYKDTTIKICDDCRLVVTSSFAFYVITFEPIEVQTRSAPQNDCLTLSFVKGTYVDCGKLARNGRKTTIYIS